MRVSSARKFIVGGIALISALTKPPCPWAMLPQMDRAVLTRTMVTGHRLSSPNNVHRHAATENTMMPPSTQIGRRAAFPGTIAWVLIARSHKASNDRMKLHVASSVTKSIVANEIQRRDCKRFTAVVVGRYLSSIKKGKFSCPVCQCLRPSSQAWSAAVSVNTLGHTPLCMFESDVLYRSRGCIISSLSASECVVANPHCWAFYQLLWPTSKPRLF